VIGGAFSPDGQHIATWSRDTTARLWDLSGKQIAIFSHTGRVLRAVFSWDGKRLLTGSADKTVRLWDLSGQLLTTFKGHTDIVRRVMFSPDGRRIVTASNDGTARQYLVDVTDLLAIAACRVGRGFTTDEITHFEVGTPHFDFARRQCPPALH
jgi:WD40 repeat protein